jgi:predicted porin
MNKKLITLAVAAALAAPAAAMAEATLYGKVHVSIDYVDVDQFANWGAVPESAGLPKSGLESATDWYVDALADGTVDPYDLEGPTTAPVGADYTLSGSDLTAADRAELDAINQDLADYEANLEPTLSDAEKAALVDDYRESFVVPRYREVFLGAVVREGAELEIGDEKYTAAEIAGLLGLSEQGLRAAAEEETQGLSYDSSNGELTWSANAYNLAYDVRLAELLDDGVEPAVADIVAIRDATRFAFDNATDDQLRAAYRDALLGARGQSFKGWTLDSQSRASRLGVKGSEDLGNGLKAIYQIEFNVDIANENRDNDIDNGNRGDGISFRNSFVGLAGNFGTFLIGRHDTPLKISTGKLDLFSDTLADYNYTIGFQDIRADNTIAYISPSWSGFSFAAAIIPAGGANPLGQFNNDNDSISSAYSLAAIYNNGPFYVSAAYENLSDDHWVGASDPLAGTIYQTFTRDDVITGLYGKGARDDAKWRIGLGLLDWNGFTLTGIYEQRTNVLGVPKSADMDLWQIQAGYAFGNNMIKGMYGQADVEKCADPFGYGYWVTCSVYGLDFVDNKDTTSWAIGFDHNFSKRTKAYALYTQMDSDQKDADWSGFSLGMIHSF